MNFKNYNLNGNTVEFLLFRDYDSDNGLPTVNIYCYWNDLDHVHVEIIQFEYEASARSFIKDFSEESAQDWIKTSVFINEDSVSSDDTK